MLVAIMNERQARNAENEAVLLVRIKLNMIVENWYLLPFTDEERLRMSYVVAAFSDEEEDEENEVISEIKDGLGAHGKKIQDTLK